MLLKSTEKNMRENMKFANIVYFNSN